MGWQTWCSVGECGEDHCFDGQIRAMADTLVLSGMKDLGYDWVVLDDCWHPTRDNATAELVPYQAGRPSLCRAGLLAVPFPVRAAVPCHPP